MIVNKYMDYFKSLQNDEFFISCKEEEPSTEIVICS